ENAGVGNGNDDVRFESAILLRQFRAETLPRFGDVVAEDDGVRTREVDMLEDASRLARRIELMHGANLVVLQHDHFAGAHFANRLRTDEIERARLRRNDERFFETPEDERTESIRIASDVDAARRKDGNRVRAFASRQRVDDSALQRRLLRTR